MFVCRRRRATQRSVTLLERTAQSESLFSAERHVMHASTNAQHFVIYQEWGSYNHETFAFFPPLEHTVQMSEVEIPVPLHNTQSVILSLKDFNPALHFLNSPPPQNRKKVKYNKRLHHFPEAQRTQSLNNDTAIFRFHRHHSTERT